MQLYNQQPFDDFNRFYRPAALLASANGGDLKQCLDYLQPPVKRQFSDLDRQIMATFGYRDE